MHGRNAVDLSQFNLDGAEEVGCGVFAKVYKKLIDNRCYAIKSTSVRNKKKFDHEVALLSQFDHPNIISYFGSKEDATLSTGLLIILEYCDQGNLFNMIESKNYNKLQARKWLFNTVSALAYLHSLYIIHCDLKSENILINGDGNAKLIDFAGSYNADEADEKIKAKNIAVVLSPAFTPPELFHGIKKANLTYAIDIYAFGLLMWELLNYESNWMSCVDKSKCVDRVSPMQLPMTMQCDGLSDVMVKCWNVEFSERPAAANLVRKLQQSF